MLHTPGFNGAGILTKGKILRNYADGWDRTITHDINSDPI